MLNKIKRNVGEMSFYTIIFVLILLIILTPAFSYIHVRQANTEAISSINNALRNKTEESFVELFDEVKTANGKSYVFSSMVNDDIFSEKFVKSVISTANFSQYKDNETNKVYYKNSAGVELRDPFLNIAKENGVYVFKLVYNLKYPISVLGLDLSLKENTYISVCNIMKNQSKESDISKTATENFGISGYIYKMKVGDGIYAYLVDDGTDEEGNNRNKLIFAGNGTMMDFSDDFKVTLEFYDGTTLVKDSFPWQWGNDEASSTYIDNSTNKTYNISSFDSVVWEADCDEIPSYLFSDCKSDFESFKLNSPVRKIGSNAFSYCDSLKYVNLAKGCKVIGANAFATCTNLSEIIFPDNLTTIRQGAFIRCNDLHEITFPASLIKIEENAFTDCYLSKVESLNFESNFLKTFTYDESPFYLSSEYVERCGADFNVNIVVKTIDKADDESSLILREIKDDI